MTDQTDLQIRADVAREVMKVRTWRPTKGAEMLYRVGSQHDWLTAEKCLPHYETSIEAAFEVVDKMREAGFGDFNLSTAGGNWGATFRGKVGKRWRKFREAADTKAKAISLAALAAIRSTK